MDNDRIQAALTEASKHLENATQALSTKNEEALVDSLWAASSETEYALFLLHLAQGDKFEDPRRHSSLAKTTRNVESALKSAQQFLQSAKASAHACDHKKGYEEAWAAQSLLQKAQDLLGKKRGEQGKK